MRKPLLFLIFSAFFSPLYAQTISLSFLSPSNYSLVTDSTVSIQVGVQATYALKNVIVTAGSTSDTVTNSSSSVYTAAFSLSGLAPDTLAIKAVATDVLNNKDSITEYIIYDPLPVLTIVKPLNFSVANPTIEVKASCKDSANGCSISINYSSAYPDSADTTLDLSPDEGTEYYIPVTATENKYHQSTSQYIHVYVESSPYLQQLFVCQDKIWDFNFDHILTARTQIPNFNIPSGSTQNTLTGLKLINLTDSSVSAIPYSGNIAFQQGKSDWVAENWLVDTYVTPYGAIFSGIPTDPTLYPYNNDSVYDWNQNTLTAASSSLLNSAFSLDVSDDRQYAIWSEGLPSSIVYRDLGSKTNTVVPSPASISAHMGNYFNDIAANGNVAFWGSRSNPSGAGYINDVVTYQNGTTTFITDSNENKEAMYPATDGQRVVYQQMLNTNPVDYQIMLYDGNSNTVLSDMGTTNPLNITRQYQINPNYVAYVKLGTSGQSEIWLRDSTGSSTRLSYFFNSSVLDKLALNGDVVYECNGIRYLSDRSGTVQEISSGNFGKVFYVNGQWYEAIGRMLYGINLNPQPDQITSFTRNLVNDTAYHFSLGDFTSQFTGAGSLMGIEITGLPGRGRLLLNGNPVALDTVLTRTDINDLEYLANGSLSGMDSIQWNATNGISFTANNAFVLLTTLTAPPKPIINPLTGSYCAGSGIQKVKITNLPDTTKGYTVTVTLDAALQPIATDSTFSINTGTLTPGAHAALVVFTNAVGSDSTSASFTILASDTPRVGITASNTTVQDSISSVTVTATAISGGGTYPQYVFASDRSFVNILQNWSSGNEVTIPASSLNIGSNWIYAQMRTSDSCYINPTATDSIQITRTGATGMVDPDFPDQPITIYPNPFHYQVTIAGLQASKTYNIFVYSFDGRQIVSQTVTGRQSWQGAISLDKGTYALKLFDVTKNRVLGTVTLLEVP